MHLLDPLALLIFPSACEVCGVTLRPAGTLWGLPRHVCPPCLASCLERAGAPAWSLDGLPGRSLFWHEGREAAWVRAIKQGGREGFLAELARLWPLPPIPTEAGTLLIPVPADRLRRRERGGDHVERLACGWALAWGLDCARLLERRGGAKQQGLDAGGRRRNLESQYRTGPRAAVQRGRSAVLVDDVVTTGATLELCRRRLETAGLRVRGALTLVCAPSPELRLSGLEGLVAWLPGREASEVLDAWPGQS